MHRGSDTQRGRDGALRVRWIAPRITTATVAGLWNIRRNAWRPSGARIARPVKSAIIGCCGGEAHYLLRRRAVLRITGETLRQGERDPWDSCAQGKPRRRCLAVWMRYGLP